MRNIDLEVSDEQILNLARSYNSVVEKFENNRVKKLDFDLESNLLFEEFNEDSCSVFKRVFLFLKEKNINSDLYFNIVIRRFINTPLKSITHKNVCSTSSIRWFRRTDSFLKPIKKAKNVLRLNKKVIKLYKKIIEDRIKANYKEKSETIINSAQYKEWKRDNFVQ